MNFSTFDFVLWFFPAVALLFHVAPVKLRLVVLLCASLGFYGYHGLWPLAGLLASVLWAHLISRWLPGRRGIAWAILVPLLVLFVAKYLAFTLDLLGVDGRARSLILPLLAVSMPAGISFYTFQLVGYSIDRAEGRVPDPPRWQRLCLFVAFFPQLIAGPIVRYDQVAPQFARLTTEKILQPNWRRALKFVSIGLFLKIFGADILRGFQEKAARADAASSIDQLFSAFSYSFVIYYDFWAYSLIAMGLGLVFCIELPRNFNEPYLAVNPQEFWRRWHITLSSWLRDYVYFRLGGNHRYLRNIFIVFVVCGIWHGAGLNFVVWGAYHTGLVVGYRVIREHWDRLPRHVAIALTFGLVSLGWPLFYLDLPHFVRLFASMADDPWRAPHIYGMSHFLYTALVAVWVFAARESRWLYNARSHAFFDAPVLHAILTFTALSFFSYSRTFIYFVF
ncbi:MAG: MBOAT family O-acyltransferase [Nannocystaceae bacterium]